VGIYVVPLALGAYKREHPKLAVSLEIGFREQLESRVRSGAIDLAVMSPPFTDPDLEATQFMEDELVMVLPPRHPLARRKRLTLADFGQESFLMREAGSGTRVAVEQAARVAGVTLPVGMELGSNGAIKHAVEAGLGVAVLSRHAIELERREGGLVVVDVAGFPIRRRWSVIRLRRRRLPGPVQGFIEFLCSGEWPAR
jgi:DNA-binding transcriptional LysR family regulator